MVDALLQLNELRDRTVEALGEDLARDLPRACCDDLGLDGVELLPEVGEGAADEGREVLLHNLDLTDGLMMQGEHLLDLQQ